MEIGTCYRNFPWGLSSCLFSYENTLWKSYGNISYRFLSYASNTSERKTSTGSKSYEIPLKFLWIKGGLKKKEHTSYYQHQADAVPYTVLRSDIKTTTYLKYSILNPYKTLLNGVTLVVDSLLEYNRAKYDQLIKLKNPSSVISEFTVHFLTIS